MLDEKQAKMIRQRLEQLKREMDEARPMPERLDPRVARPRLLLRPGFVPSQGRLGVRVSIPSGARAVQLDLKKGQGLVIDEVLPGSPAAKAGVKASDVLVEVAGKTVT